jgi:flavin reductase (DIM6/NTAB) family NADH-FMN oxidoreductase RutF
LFKLIADDWMLITAEHKGRVNTMTASWGGFGHIWNKYAAYFFIRPQRYTKTFVDAQDTVSLCVLGGSCRDTLNYLGTASGRNEDKIEKAHLTVLYEDGTPYFAESQTVFICKKLFSQPFTEQSFYDKNIISACYPEKDFHTLYIAEIQQILVREAAKAS